MCPKIRIKDTVTFFSQTAISILVISNRNGFGVLFDEIVDLVTNRRAIHTAEVVLTEDV